VLEQERRFMEVTSKSSQTTADLMQKNQNQMSLMTHVSQMQLAGICSLEGYLSTSGPFWLKPFQQHYLQSET